MIHIKIVIVNRISTMDHVQFVQRADYPAMLGGLSCKTRPTAAPLQVWIDIMNKDEYVRVLEKNQEAILAHVLKIEREIKDLRAFVRELLHAVNRMERRSREEVHGR